MMQPGVSARSSAHSRCCLSACRLISAGPSQEFLIPLCGARSKKIVSLGKGGLQGRSGAETNPTPALRDYCRFPTAVASRRILKPSPPSEGGNFRESDHVHGHH